MSEGQILGVNRRTYPCEWLEPVILQAITLGKSDDVRAFQETCTVSVVLVAGDPARGDYAAYAGIGSPDWVAGNGHKIPYEEACVHFPGGQLERARYRD